MERKRQELVEQLKSMIQQIALADDIDAKERRLPPERELALSLGVSRNLLREAMITLEAMGYLEIRERQGAFIINPYAEDFASGLKFVSLWPDDMLIHVMEMRKVVEVPIAGLAALRRRNEELARMKQCIDMLIQAHQEPDGGASKGAQWDSLLHMQIVNAAHNPLLTRLYEALSATMDRYISMSRLRLLALPGWPSKIVAEHREIVDAIEAGDAGRAEKAQRQHLESALEQLRLLSAQKPAP